MMRAPFQSASSAAVPDSGARAAGGARVAHMLEAYYSDVWRVLRRLGMAESVIEDGAQQVFIVASTKLDRIEPEKERAFLLGTAVRVAANHRRSAVVRYERAAADIDLGCDPSPGVDELVDEKRLRGLLDEVLATLPDDLRSVLVLFELEEQSVADIAQMLGIPRGTAASRLRRAREAFEATARRLRARQPGRPGRADRPDTEKV
jgi:RNA polymerase sigma-70 factor (ECF subfamily)